MKFKPKKLSRVAILPTLFTLGNLLCGFGALTYAVKGNYLQAAQLVFVGMVVFDGLDGLIARATKSASQFGAQLDSLADVVTFGIAPAFLAYSIIHRTGTHFISYKFTFVICAFYVACAALRLARYNVETGKGFDAHEYFAGLPTPGAAGMLMAIIIFHEEPDLPYNVYRSEIIPLLLPFVTLILAFLMVSRMRYMHPLNRLIKSKHRFMQLVQITLVVLLMYFRTEETLIVAFLVYTLSGPFTFLVRLFPKYRTQPKLTGEPESH
ncbi:MAG: CDP-diacylglycerol--serine O-phosphatidyltransferase [Planctomycetes bacterium]|nr:CDP-diacylglycerol--serine O-phosphatidyltransferase [Planctomycetota bacterium]